MEGPEIKAVEAVIDNGSFGKRTLRFETGRLAQQADGAVAAYLDDDSMILSTTTAGSSPKENYDFFPLTVDVEEKMYAAGKIPGSFFRREGRPSSEAILACRIIDRPLRPLFPHTLRNEVQVVETVLAVNPDDAYDVIALNAASASTMISGLPFEGPVSGVRLALIDGQWVAFPRWSERERAVFEIVVAGRVIENGDVAIAMIEAGAGKNAWHLIYDEGQTKPDEEVVAGGLEAAKPFIKVICEAQDELKKIAAKETKEFQLFPEYTDELYARIDEIAHKDLDEALSIAEKLPRQDRIHEIKEHVREVLADEFTDMDDAEKDKELGNAFKELQRQIVRRRLLTEDYRIDGPAEMSEFAPRIITTSVPVEKIGEVIGPKGKMINQIQEDTGAEIAIEDDGTVFISSEGGEAAEKAKAIIDQIANPHVPEAGETYNGKVVKTTSFGAFVNLTPGTDGLLHISQIRNLANGERIDAVEDVLKEGDTVEVIVQGVDDRGKISLAIPGFEDQENNARPSRGDRDDRRGGRGRGDRDDRRGGRGRRSDRDDRDFDDRDDRPRRRRSDDFEDDYDDRPRRRRSDDRDFDRDDRDDDRPRRRRSADRDFDDRDDRDARDSRDDDRPRRRRSSDRDDRGDRDDRRGGSRGRGRGSDRNPRYATDDNYDDYRADREERTERPRRRVRRDFDPFED